MSIVSYIKTSKTGIYAILLFYVIAIVCRITAIYILPSIFVDAQQTIWLQLCEGAGPALGALAVMFLFKRKLYCSLFGLSWLRSIACIAIPVFLFLVFDRENGTKASLIFIGCITYALLEEVGWRGYLTGEFASLNQFKRILIITAFWFFWHINFPLGISGIIFFLILLLASWGLDQLARDTHSLMLCACLHGIFNLFKHNNGLLENRITITLLVLSIVSWFLIWYLPFKKYGT